MIVTAKIRIGLHIRQYVVHPAHIPLKVETQTAHVHRLGHERPCGGFFRDHHCLRVLRKHGGVEFLQKRDRFQIFILAVDIRDPLAGFFIVIEIKHRCDRIYAQPVDMITVKIKQRVGYQKRQNLVAPVIEYACAPTLMLHTIPLRALV